MWPVLDLHVLSFRCSLYSLSLYSFLSSYREILLINACSILNCTDTTMNTREWFQFAVPPPCVFQISGSPIFFEIFCVVSFRFVSFRFVSFRVISFRFVSFRFVSFRFVSFRFISFRFVSFFAVFIFYTKIRTYLPIFVSFRFISFRFVSFRFVLFHSVSFRFISFRFVSFFRRFFVSFFAVSFFCRFPQFATYAVLLVGSN